MSNHLKSITPLTIESIRAWEFVGNHHSDSAAFKSIETFAADPAQPIQHRAEALRIMGNKGMGLTDAEMGIDGLSDAAQVAEFMDSIEE